MDLVTSLCTVVAILACILLLIFLYVTLIIYRVHAKYDHLPGPKRSSFFFGNANFFKDTRRHNKDFADKEKKVLKPVASEVMLNLAERYGETIVVFIIHKAIIYSMSLNVLKTVLITSDQRDFPKTSRLLRVQRLFGDRYLGDGLTAATDHDAWHLRRKALDPVFHRNQLRLSVDVFNATGDHFIEELRGYAESGQSVKLSPIFLRTALDVIMKGMFSMDSCNLTSEFHQKTLAFVIDSFSSAQLAANTFVEYNPFSYRFRQKIRKQLSDFREIGAQMIRERKVAVCNGEHVPSDMLTTMVKASLDPSVGYTFDIMVDDFVSMVIAGMETSAATLGFLFRELGRRPDLMSRLIAEVDEMVGKKTSISNDDITKLSFTATLIKETLRLYPPAFAVVRQCAKEVQIDGLKFPEGADILISLLGANTNERYLDDAKLFNPDRFDASQDKRVPIYSLSSFSFGARNCIGQVFAQMEMKVMVAKFFQHYEFVLDESETFQMGHSITIYPLSGVQCIVRARH